MTEIYIVRHGQTNSNLRNACIGVTDIPLNEEGIRQSHEVFKRLSGIEFDVIYTSPLSRAVDTVAPYMKENPTTPLHMSYAFIERDFGEWEDLNYAEIREKDPLLYEKWQSDVAAFKLPGGESSNEVRERVDKALAKILSRHEGKRILIVTHLLTARHIIASLLGLEKEKDIIFSLDNGSVAKVEIRKGKGVLTLLNG